MFNNGKYKFEAQEWTNKISTFLIQKREPSHTYKSPRWEFSSKKKKDFFYPKKVGVY